LLVAVDGVAPRSRALFGRGFRPFFLAAALQAMFGVLVWTAIWLGALPAPLWLTPAWWHGHEMVFGFVAAAIAGFLLTATPVWTGRAALCGAPLAALVALWAAGRVAMLGAGVLPPWGVGAVDAAFLPALALVLARTLWRSGQVRNYGIVLLVAVLALANAAMHAAAIGLLPASAAARALRLGVDGVVVLLLVVGGRITPAFTANALRRLGDASLPRSFPWLDRATIGAAALFALADLVARGTAWCGAAALVAGVAAACRLLGWRGWAARSDALVWSLHAGMAWAAAGLIGIGAADLGAPIPEVAGLHALTAGAMGLMILAVMTRVGLGHTGRPLTLPKWAVASYVLVQVGALLRVAAPFFAGEDQRLLLLCAGLAWAAAFGWFAALYAPILTRPRIDGKPG
jgi:uncharacterized protein involved in response to NO